MLSSDACIHNYGHRPSSAGNSSNITKPSTSLATLSAWLRDLEEAWKKENERTRIEVTRDDAYLRLDFDISAPRQTVWGTFHGAAQRQKWWAAGAIIENSSNRRGE